MSKVSLMGDAMFDTVQALQAHLVPGLSTPAGFGRLLELARVLPGIHRGGIECRLAGEDSQVDLFQAIAGSLGEPEGLLRWIDQGAADGHGHPAWQRLRAFCAAWSDPASVLHANVSAIWLELDAGVPAPSVFITLLPEALKGADPEAITAEALTILLGAEAVAALRNPVRACFDAAAGIAHVRQVGVMLARQARAVRIVVHPLGSQHITAYLTRVGWPGALDQVETLVNELRGKVDRIDLLHLDVGERVLPKVGLEGLCDETRGAGRGWSAFLDHLVAQGWCTPSKRAALLAWPGTTDLAPGPSARLPDKLTVLRRRLSHVKLVHQPGVTWEAKAYLWFGRIRFGLVPALLEEGIR